MTTDGRLLRLAREDNVLVAVTTLAAGEQVLIDGQRYHCPVALPLGHKLAARPIGAGEKIIKYGAPIGSATRAIAVGEHIHTHNMQSDYLPTHLRGEQSEG
jgi:altronate dehydratase small subunit